MTNAERDQVRRLFGAVVRATCPDDPCGHLPNCGYTDEHQTCGCSEWGKRLHDAIAACVLPPAEHDATARCPDCPKRADEPCCDTPPYSVLPPSGGR